MGVTVGNGKALVVGEVPRHRRPRRVRHLRNRRVTQRVRPRRHIDLLLFEAQRLVHLIPAAGLAVGGDEQRLRVVRVLPRPEIRLDQRVGVLADDRCGERPALPAIAEFTFESKSGWQPLQAALLLHVYLPSFFGNPHFSGR